MRTYEMGGLQLNCNNVDTLDGVGKVKLAGGGSVKLQHAPENRNWGIKALFTPASMPLVV